MFGARSVSNLNQAVPASAPVSEPAATARRAQAATPSRRPRPPPPPRRSPPADRRAGDARAGRPAAPVDLIRVDDAERQSQRFAEEAQDTEGDGDERLTQELRDTASAYREAVTAASAGDGAAFSAALARADQLARAATARLDGD